MNTPNEYSPAEGRPSYATEAFAVAWKGVISPMRLYDPELQKQWLNDVGMPLRFPRVGNAEVVEGVKSAWPPTIFMVQDQESTDIVIRFPWSSKVLPPEHREAFFDKHVTLERVFDDLISRPREKGESAVERKLASEAYDAYKMTWLHLFKSMHLDERDPRHEPPKWLEEMENEFKTKGQGGRPKKDETRKLERRFRLFLDHCGWLNREIDMYQKQTQSAIEGNRVHVLRKFWREILKVPCGRAILGGEAFLNIPYGNQTTPVKLEDPTSWTPRQLAISLLAFEREQDYHTIERKVAPYE
jgi:hypothetical protein